MYDATGVYSYSLYLAGACLLLSALLLLIPHKLVKYNTAMLKVESMAC